MRKVRSSHSSANTAPIKHFGTSQPPLWVGTAAQKRDWRTFSRSQFPPYTVGLQNPIQNPKSKPPKSTKMVDCQLQSAPQHSKHLPNANQSHRVLTRCPKHAPLPSITISHFSLLPRVGARNGSFTLKNDCFWTF